MPAGQSSRTTEIFDCDSTGLLLETGSSAHCQNMRFYYNSVRDCGGHGFDFEGLGSGEFVGNTVDHVGGDGIHFATPGTVSASQNDIDGTGGFGIWSRSAASIIDNRVVHAGTDGISCSSAYAMERNRVGRSGGRGIVARSTATRVHHNTVYLNAGAGFEVHGAIPDSVHHNIAYANTGPGLPVGRRRVIRPALLQRLVRKRWGHDLGHHSRREQRARQSVVLRHGPRQRHVELGLLSRERHRVRADRGARRGMCAGHRRCRSCMPPVQP